jgi:cyclase
VELLRAVSSAVPVPVVASGGAGTLEHFYDALTIGGADAVLAASLFHDRRMTVGQVKGYLAERGVIVRPV